MNTITKHITGYKIVEKAYLVDIKSFNIEQELTKPQQKKFSMKERGEKILEVFAYFVEFIKEEKKFSFKIDTDFPKHGLKKEFHNDILLTATLGSIVGVSHFGFYKTSQTQPKNKPPKPFSGKIEDVVLLGGKEILKETFLYEPYVYKRIGLVDNRILFMLPKDYDINILYTFFQRNFLDIEFPNFEEAYYQLKSCLIKGYSK